MAKKQKSNYFRAYLMGRLDKNFIKVFPSLVYAIAGDNDKPDVKARLIFFFMEEIMKKPQNSDNMVMIKNGDLQQRVDTTLPTLLKKIKELEAIKFVKKFGPGVYKVNQDMVYKGQLYKYYETRMDECNQELRDEIESAHSDDV